MALIEISNIGKYFKDGNNYIEALKDVSLSVDKGDMLAIMGPSGSGKSTLLNVLGFMDRPSRGKYILDGKATEKFTAKEYARYRNKMVSFIFQDYNLLEDYNVYDNVEIPLLYRKISSKEKKALIMSTLRRLDIDDKYNVKASKLSGGQRQRVAIARTLVTGTDIILADEPTGALDQERGKEIMGLLKELNEEGKTIIVVTHDSNVAALCDKTLRIVDGYMKDENLLPQQ